MKPGNPRREERGRRHFYLKSNKIVNITLAITLLHRLEKEEEREGWEGGFDGNYEVGACGMEWVHNREPERSRVTS